MLAAIEMVQKTVFFFFDLILRKIAGSVLVNSPPPLEINFEKFMKIFWLILEIVSY